MISQSQIRKFLHIHDSSNIFKRAKAIFKNTPPELIEIKHEESYASFSVNSSNSPGKRYTVELFDLDSQYSLECRCTCPYDGPVCKHSLASLMELDDILSAEERPKKPNQGKAKEAKGLSDENLMDLKADSLHSLLRDITSESRKSPKREAKRTLPTFKLAVKQSLPIPDPLSSNDLLELTEGNPDFWTFLKLRDDYVSSSILPNGMDAHFFDNRKRVITMLRMDKDHTVTCECNCKPRKKLFCKHAAFMLKRLAQKNSNEGDVLFPFRDHSGSIARGLAEYGFTLEDNWKAKFTAHYEYPYVWVEPLDKGLSKTREFANWAEEISQHLIPQIDVKNPVFQDKAERHKYALVWTAFTDDLPIPSVYLLQGKIRKNGEMGAPFKAIGATYYTVKNLPKKVHQLWRKLLTISSARIIENRQLSKYERDPEVMLSASKEVYEELYAAMNMLLSQDHYLTDADVSKSTIPKSKLFQIYLKQERPTLMFDLTQVGQYFHLIPFLQFEEAKIELSKLELFAYGMILLDQALYFLEREDAATVTFFLMKGVYKVRAEDIEAFTEEFILPLAEKYSIHSPERPIDMIEVASTFSAKVYLKEIEDYLLMIPAFEYTSEGGASREVYLDGKEKLIFQESGQTIMISRNAEEEVRIRKLMDMLHQGHGFKQNYYYATPIKQVMQDGWFFQAYRELQEEGIGLFGLKELKKLAYNPNPPSMQLRASSGTDWFDVEIEVAFGDQRAKLTDIRKAIVKRQNFIKLSDGTLGMLPEEWLKKYSSLFKLTKVSKDKVSISAFQASIIDEIVGEIDHAEVFEELFQKREKLASFTEIKEISLPKQLKATLRNYQIAGYNWLNFLDEFGWGGCLADDMGLGKTIQMLAFLSKQIALKPKESHLIVVPRSLIFNWVKEAEKFCPHLKVFTHSGTNRIKKTKHFSDYDLIITTYGLVRSDIQWLREYSFGYVVLDESQAIKNPLTQSAKAVKLLNSRNRLVMTGTPIENNTFDLYSQMDFLNRGMLGSMDVFKREYATPIDKERNEEVAAELRKIIYPFILSRKKHEVAKELPEKTEIILYGEMPSSQRKVYDYYKGHFKDLILGKIEEEGLNKSGMYVLQGLSKLRQICNSPQLLSADEGEFTEDSIKMELLMEHLEDIIPKGNKVLVFSFFTGMLSLIGEELNKRKIGWVTLTGQSRNREELVEQFKQDTSKSVFLISLKAGGFGLNLTEASYVFLIDPWWNPAVEQQAIDRTHRIGQDQQVFAYKMICKDTIEEKILAIQEKKLAVSQDLIHTEGGFLKQLKKEDIEELFG